MTERSAADEEIMRLATEPEEVVETVEPEKVEEEVEQPVNDEVEETEEKPEKRRSKPAHQRIAELTAKLRQTERDLEASRKPAEAVETPVATDLKAPDPNDPKYEFGEADPNYLADLTEYKVDLKLADREQKAADEAHRTRVAEVSADLNGKWEAKAAAAVEKYPDFNEVVLESAAAGEWPCGPILAIAISASDQGADIAYHLASNPKEAEELNRLAETDPMEAARRFGRMEARFEAGNDKPNERKVTKAPKPAEHTARGASGQFEVSDDTEDFAAFEKKVMGKR